MVKRPLVLPLESISSNIAVFVLCVLSTLIITSIVSIIPWPRESSICFRVFREILDIFAHVSGLILSTSKMTILIISHGLNVEASDSEACMRVLYVVKLVSGVARR